MIEADADARALEALLQHPRREVLANLARAVMEDAARGAALPPAAQIEALAMDLQLVHDQASTPFGNALDVLVRGPKDDAERALSCALAALGSASRLRGPSAREGDGATGAAEETGTAKADARGQLAADLLWLAANTGLDATGLLDRVLGDGASEIWVAIADQVRAIDRANAAPSSTGRARTRAEALAGATALAMSTSKEATRLAVTLADEVRDPKLAFVLSRPPAGESVAPFEGDLSPAPRGLLATAAMAITGLLVLTHGARLLGRLALAYRRPTLVSLVDDGAVRVKSRTELLGRTLRDRDVLVPRAALLRATREVRYPSLAMYAGLFALAVGSYVGVATFVDGVRAASPSLLATGLAIAAIGLGLDFALARVAPGATGQCRVLLESRDGVRLCIAAVDPQRADALLARLAGR